MSSFKKSDNDYRVAVSSISGTNINLNTNDSSLINDESTNNIMIGGFNPDNEVLTRNIVIANGLTLPSTLGNDSIVLSTKDMTSGAIPEDSFLINHTGANVPFNLIGSGVQWNGITSTQSDGSGVLSYNSTTGEMSHNTGIVLDRDNLFIKASTLAKGTAPGFMAYDNTTETLGYNSALVTNTNKITNMELNTKSTGTSFLAYDVKTATVGYNTALFGTSANKITNIGLNAKTTGTSFLIHDSSDSSVGFSTGLSTDGTNLTCSQVLYIPDGTLANPGLAFASDINTGLYKVSNDNFGFVAGGVRRLALLSTGASFSVPVKVDNGTVAAPVYSFNNNATSGFYTDATNMLWSVGGVLKGELRSNAFISYTDIQIPSGGLINSAATTWGSTSVRDSTTASSANMFINTTTGLFSRSTSSIRYKVAVTDLASEYTSKLYDIRPISYKSNTDICVGDNPDTEHIGIIAEELALILPELVEYNDSNEPESVQYNRIIALVIAEMKRLRARIELLEAP